MVDMAQTQPRPRLWSLSVHRRLPFLCVAVFLLLVPLFLSMHLQDLMTKVLIFAILGMSLDLLMGYTGLFSLGHAAYFGVGGYTAGILMVRYGVESFWLNAPAGVLMALVVAALFGLVALRVAEIYFLLVTFALGQLLFSVAWKWYPMTGGSDGLAGMVPPDLGVSWISLETTSFYYFIFVIFLLSLLLLSRIINSPFGYALQGIRENEARMQSLGYNTWIYKYLAFVTAGGMGGVAGVLFAYQNGLMTPYHLDISTSAEAMLIVIIGGQGTLIGSVVGAAIIILMDYFASLYAPERWPLVLGAVFVASVMFARGGVWAHLLRIWNRASSRYGNAEG